MNDYDLKAFIGTLHTVDTDDDMFFTTVVSVALEHSKLTLTDFADEFGVGTGTVERWADSKYRPPHPGVRPRIVRWMRDQLIAHYKDLYDVDLEMPEELTKREFIFMLLRIPVALLVLPLVLALGIIAFVVVTLYRGIFEGEGIEAITTSKDIALYIIIIMAHITYAFVTDGMRGLRLES